VIDVFAGRQWRDRSIGEEVKVGEKKISRGCFGLHSTASKVKFNLILAPFWKTSQDRSKVDVQGTVLPQKLSFHIVISRRGDALGSPMINKLAELRNDVCQKVYSNGVLGK